MQAELGFDNFDPPSEDLLLECVHCGLCLQACPTYRTLGLEADSPRGRLYLMNEVLHGRTALTKEFVDHMNRCLLCRACESACPAGVSYGRLMEAVRGQIRRRFRQSVLERLTRYVVFKTLFMEQGRLEFLFGISRLYQKTFLQAAIRRTGLIRLFPKRVKILDEYMPSIPPKFFRTTEHLLTPPEGRKEHRVGFFSGCIMSLVFPSANESTISVLAKNGCEIVTPSQQKCCGALHIHNGELETAKQLAKANIDAFEEANVDLIISNAGGCGTTLREYTELLRQDPQYASRAERFSKKVRDLSEFLSSINLNKSFGRIEAKATYQDSCHAAHVRKIKDQPRALIKAIPGIEFIEMKDADRCCASGGSYWFTNHDLSMKILESKIADLGATGANLIISANPPCLLQLQLAVARTGTKAKVIHLAELLDCAYQIKSTA